MPPEIEALMIGGWVGEDNQVSWVSFKENNDLPTAEEVLLNWNTPNAWKIDNDRQDRTLTVTRSIRMFVLGIQDSAEQVEMAKKAWGFLNDLEKEGHIDMVLPVAQDFANRKLGRGIDQSLDTLCEPLLKRIGKTDALKYVAK